MFQLSGFYCTRVQDWALSEKGFGPAHAGRFPGNPAIVSFADLAVAELAKLQFKPWKHPSLTWMWTTKYPPYRPFCELPC